jgi:transketolase
MEAARLLREEGVNIRVVSMPCCEAFKEETAQYRESVLPAGVVARVAVEAGVSDYWYQFTGLRGRIIGINRFGLSAPAKAVSQAVGLTVENIIAAVHEIL